MAECMMGRFCTSSFAVAGVMAPTTLAPGRAVCQLPGFQWLDSLAVEANVVTASGRTLSNGGVTTFQPGGAYEHMAFPTP